MRRVSVWLGRVNHAPGMPHTGSSRSGVSLSPHTQKKIGCVENEAGYSGSSGVVDRNEGRGSGAVRGVVGHLVFVGTAALAL